MSVRRMRSLLLPAALALATAGALQGQGAFLVADLNAGPSPYVPSTLQDVRGLTPVGDRLVYIAIEPASGVAIWVTDGTALGTRLLRDLTPFEQPDTLEMLGSNGEVAFFFFRPHSIFPTNDAPEVGVWRTDGTSAGTFPLGFGGRWVNPGYGFSATVASGRLFATGCTLDGTCELWSSAGSAGDAVRLASAPAPAGGFKALTGVGDAVYSTLIDSDRRTQLWRSDGTLAGTARVQADVSFEPWELLAAAGSRLVFVADSAQGQELWASDGTTTGTQPLTAFTAPEPFTRTPFLRTLGDVVYFVADDGSGSDLWRSDGTAGGTHRVTDLPEARPFEYLLPQSLAQAGDRLFFPAPDGGPFRLWTSHGTPASSAVISGCAGGCPRLDPRDAMLGLGSRVLFTGRSGDGSVVEVWSSDGTGAGTVRLPAKICAFCNEPPRFTAIGGLAYFLANDSTAEGFAVWVSDGTPEGTRQLRRSERPTFHLSQFFVAAGVGGRALFTAVDRVLGLQLWRSDGTTAGTTALAPLPTTEASSEPSPIAALEQRGLVFAAYDGDGRPLWFSDGTAPGTFALTALREQLRDGWVTGPLVPHGGLVYFVVSHVSGQHYQLWRTDGTDAGTLQLTNFSNVTIGDVVVYQGAIVVAVMDPRLGSGAALWTSDGTPQGTHELLELPAAAWQVRNLTALGAELYFVGRDTSGVEQAWRSDGTPSGTRALTAPAPSAFAAGSATFTHSGPTVFFRGGTSDNSTFRLWRTDGTTEGTALVKPGDDSPGVLEPTQLTAVDGGVLYFAWNGVGDDRARALYRSDGSTAGTVELARLSSPEPDDLYRRLGPTAFAGGLYFAADDGEHGEELWVTDGTATGTRILRDLTPGPLPSRPRSLTVAGGRLFFSATDGEHGVELWESDGTAAGTRMVQDLAPGGHSSNPASLTVLGNKLFFAADDGIRGSELWGLSLSAGGCQATAERLCLRDGRYAVEAHWRDFAGRSGAGRAVALTADTGYFWFFGPDNVEVVLKVLDGRGVNDHVWVFYGALSSVEYALTVTDTLTGAARRYVNPSGRLGSVADTAAFGPRGATPSAPSFGPSATPTVHSDARRRTAAAAPCVPAPTRLCLRGGRFAVEARWTIPGTNGAGQAVPLTGDTGYLWFFNADNVELVVKVLDGRPVNGKFWVFYGALSDVEYTLTVTDTATGRVKEYRNPRGQLASAADTSAF